MAKKKQADEEGVSLFPFMSILACLIGILTLMISVSMSANQQKEGLTQEELQRAKENERIKRMIVEMKREVQELEKKSEKENVAALELKQLQAQRNNLSSKLADLEAPDEQTDAALQQKIELMRKETIAIKEEQPTLEKRIAELKAELEKRKLQPKPKESVRISPGGSLRALQGKLLFVECNSTGITIREKGKDPVIISTAAIKDSVEFAEFCNRASALRDSQVVFLMRKAGNSSYRWAAGIAQSTYNLNVGKLPIPNDGDIDLSLFWKR